MIEPFNKAARKKALDVWDSDNMQLMAAHDIGRLLRDGNMNDYDRLTGLILDLEMFADDLKRAVATLDEEDE